MALPSQLETETLGEAATVLKENPLASTREEAHSDLHQDEAELSLTFIKEWCKNGCLRQAI